MGRNRLNFQKLRHDRHTVSMLTDHLVFSPKYRETVLVDSIAVEAEKIIREICNEMNIEIIDMAVNKDHVHLFFKYPLKYSVSYIAKKLKGVSSKKLRERFPSLRKWCPESLWAPSCFHGSVGHGTEVVEKYIRAQKNFNYENERER